MAPAKVLSVEIDEQEKKAQVEVPEDQLSLAIGKRGQNVRLAAKLTDWKIDVKGAADILAQELAEENENLEVASEEGKNQDIVGEKDEEDDQGIESE